MQNIYLKKNYGRPFCCSYNMGLGNSAEIAHNMKAGSEECILPLCSMYKWPLIQQLEKEKNLHSFIITQIGLHIAAKLSDF